MFETQDRWILKLLSKLMNVYSLTVLSTRCFHTWGGAKMMLREMHQILDELRLTLRPEKTFVGRNHKGFDLLGYHITPNGFSPNQKTQGKALEKAKRRYAHGDRKSLDLYLHRWRIPAFARTGLWVQAGLPFKVQSVETVVASMAEKVTALDGIRTHRE